VASIVAALTCWGAAVFASPATSAAVERATPATSSVAVKFASVTRTGHASNPVWYHDSTSVTSGGHTYVAWMSDSYSVQARTWSNKKSKWLGPASRVSTTVLDCGCKDSTGTNPNRHDVPAIFTDRYGRVYTLYGGGTASYLGPGNGPFFRAASTLGGVTGWGAERRLDIPGAMVDVEVARNSQGTNFAIGQQGGNPSGAGSLLMLKIPSGTKSTPGSPLPYQTIVRGGHQPVCTWRSSPNCDVFVIGRIGLGPIDTTDPSKPQPIYVTWGWSEANLSGTCGDPAGFCDRGLYMAVSLDGGTTWQNASGSVTTSSAISFDDPNYAVVAPSENVGLFKAIAISGTYPGTPTIIYQPGADTSTGEIAATTYTGVWSSPTVVDSSRPWNNHLVARVTSTGHLYVWSDVAQSGSNRDYLAQWTGTVGGATWTKILMKVGPNWFLTGTPSGSSEALMWRGPLGTSSSYVRFTRVSTP
jgi:hypothetical protein